MSTEQIKAIAANHYKNSDNIEAAFKLVSPRVEFHALPGLPPTYDGWYQAHSMFLAAIPDMALTIEDQVAEGNLVVTRWTFRGTHKGPLMGIPASGKAITLKGISIDKVEDGLVTGHSAQIDQVGMLQQIGAMPAPQGA